MLLFILSGSRFRPTHVWFQYISCYCLSRQPSLNPRLNSISIHLMLLFIRYLELILLHLPNFNTSHVTVYLNHRVHHNHYLRFQYISCYCLSALLLAISWYPTDFNTSHVTVYLFCFEGKSNQTVISIHLMLLFIFVILYNLSSYLNFNTSHVTVYRRWWCSVVSCRWISIHLMLLFIEKKNRYPDKGS